MAMKKISHSMNSLAARCQSGKWFSRSDFADVCEHDGEVADVSIRSGEEIAAAEIESCSRVRSVDSIGELFAFRGRDRVVF
jgi:hypothetical protein